MRKQSNPFISILRCRKGQGTVEYALTTLAIVLILGIVLFATNNPLRLAISRAFQRASDCIDVNGTGC